MLGTKVLEERKSKFNGNVRVVKTFGTGTYIQANGLTQSGGIVESIWRSTLRKILNSKFLIHNSLILGLGGGTVANLIRRFWPESKITGVEIDPLMIELGKKYLDLDKQGVLIVDSDAFDFFYNSNPSGPTDTSNQKFDLIIVDLYLGDKFPKKFETKNYIQLVRINLASGGVAVFNRLSYGNKKRKADAFEQTLKTVFTKVDVVRPVANLMYFCYY